jgi:SAM-dependent methyltransferase
MTDVQTLAVYDAKIEDYLRLTQAPPSKSLLAFIKAIPEGGRVLDLGCGPGLAAAEMARQGCNVEAIDGSAEMVAAASKHPGVTAQQATFDELPSQATIPWDLCQFFTAARPARRFQSPYPSLPRSAASWWDLAPRHEAWHW